MCEAQNLKIAYNMPADPAEVLLANSGTKNPGYSF